jgi:hypothetical protein
MLLRSQVDRPSMNRAQGRRFECLGVGKCGALAAETKGLNAMWRDAQGEKQCQRVGEQRIRDLFAVDNRCVPLSQMSSHEIPTSEYMMTWILRREDG